MKILLCPLIALALVSCGGSSEISVEGEVQTLNFSEAKYNEDLLGKFAIPEMKKAIASLNNIKNKTSNCSAAFNSNNLKLDWREAALTYQRLRPIEISLLDRNPETSLKLTERYLGGAYSASSCNLQQNTAEQLFLRKTLIDDPAINSLEFLIFADLQKQNFCSGAIADRVSSWIDSDAKAADLCRHINYISDLAVEQLTEINAANEELYKNGQTAEVFATSNLQAVYDNISVFIDQILKDNTLGQPLGLSKKCPFEGKTCPTAIEHRAAKITFEAVSKNLEGIMAVYNSKTSVSPAPQQKGLYQFLLANQKGDVANAFYNNIVQAHTLSTSLHGQSLEKIAESLNSSENKEKCLNPTTQDEVVPACLLFASIKSLSDKVKKDLRLALAVSSTKQIEGDSD